MTKRRNFVIGFVIGWAVLAFGLWTLFANASNNRPGYTLWLALKLNILHDAIFAPLVCILGYLLFKVLPVWTKAAAVWVLFTTFVVLAIGYVPLRGLGKKGDNPSVAPLDYSTAVPTVVGVVWVIGIAVAVYSGLRFRQSQREEPSS